MNFFINIFEIDIIAIIFMSVFLGAIIKGAVGIGMSMFSVPIIAFFLPPTTAMILLCVPVLITNILQMQIKKGVGSYRFLPMFIALILGARLGYVLFYNFEYYLANPLEILLPFSIQNGVWNIFLFVNVLNS